MITLLLAKTTLVLLLGISIAALLRTRSSATRHFIWALTLFGALITGIAAMVAPPVTVPISYVPETRSAAVPAAEWQASPPAVRGGGTPPVQPAKTPAFRPGLGTLWLAGFLGVTAWFVIGHLGLARLSRSATPATDEWVADMTHVSVAFSSAVTTPVTWGWAHPLILLPVGAQSWPMERRRAALLHELGHVVRRDYLIQIIASAVCAVYWFHPLVWIAMRRLRIESEHACDDFVLSGGAEAPEYASHLLDVARIARGRRFIAHAALDMARPSQLEGRVLAVLDSARKRTFVSWRARIVSSLIVMTLLVPFAVARPVLRAVQNILPATKTEKKAEKKQAPLPPSNEDMLAASPGERLLLDLETGAGVDIQGWDEPRVRVRWQAGGRDSRDVRTVTQRDDGGVRVRMTYEGSKQSHSTSMKLQVRVPRRFDVQLESAGGDLTIREVEGTFSGSTGGGEIILENVKGSAKLSTGGGEIEVSDSDLDGRVSTGGGAVRFSRVRGGLRGSSGSGPITYVKDDRGEIGDLKSGAGRLHMSKAGGEISIDEVPHGAEVSTGGGDIEIGRGAGLVEASTGGGDIRIGPIAGSVRAGTGAGRVEITLIDAGGAEQSVHVRTGNGRVTIHLPAGFDGRFELETAYTETSRRTQIDSDWSLVKSETDQWDDREGTPRKYVRARGTAGSGRGVVRVHTVNGDVFIRRDGR